MTKHQLVSITILTLNNIIDAIKELIKELKKEL